MEDVNQNKVSMGELVRRVSNVEDRIEKLEGKVEKINVVDVGVKSDIKSLKTEFSNVKNDVLATLQDHNEKTWKLTDKLGKIIVVLLIAILLLVGIKIAPEILKLL